MNSFTRRSALLGGLIVAGSWAATATVASASGIADPLVRDALATPRALSAVLLGIARAGDRIVAVGERGMVLLSDDGGASWRQANVPVSTTLTAVDFPTPSVGFAVGHAGVVLRSADGGQTWVRLLDGIAAAKIVLAASTVRAEGQASDPKQLADAQRLVQDGADKPFLDVKFSDALHGWVLGAYGLVFRTADGGKSWNYWGDRVDNPKGLHLNAIALRGSSVVLVGEQGQIWRSSDGGEHFSHLSSPYEGSWFGVAVLESGRVVVGGLRGNIWHSDDQGANFFQSKASIAVTIASLQELSDGALLALNQAGQVLVSADQGSNFQAIGLPPGPPFTAFAQLGYRTLVGASMAGPRRLQLPANLSSVATSR